jgi:hypothetical protein
VSFDRGTASALIIAFPPDRLSENGGRGYGGMVQVASTIWPESSSFYYNTGTGFSFDYCGLVGENGGGALDDQSPLLTFLRIPNTDEIPIQFRADD